nr:hypothetical protein [Kitasatospora sp. NBC_01266]
MNHGSTFSTVKLRTKATPGAGNPAAALAMVFTLVESAQERWRAIMGARLVALVRSGARFGNGLLVERAEVAACPSASPQAARPLRWNWRSVRSPS